MYILFLLAFSNIVQCCKYGGLNPGPPTLLQPVEKVPILSKLPCYKTADRKIKVSINKFTTLLLHQKGNESMKPL